MIDDQTIDSSVLKNEKQRLISGSKRNKRNLEEEKMQFLSGNSTPTRLHVVIDIVFLLEDLKLTIEILNYPGMHIF